MFFIAVAQELSIVKSLEEVLFVRASMHEMEEVCLLSPHSVTLARAKKISTAKVFPLCRVVVQHTW